jgi:hypothetical protein
MARARPVFGPSRVERAEVRHRVLDIEIERGTLRAANGGGTTLPLAAARDAATHKMREFGHSP